MKKIFSSLLILSLALSLLSCKNTKTIENAKIENSFFAGDQNTASPGTSPSIPKVSYPDNAVSGEVDEKGVENLITFNNDSISASGSGITTDGATVTITKAGSYLLQGKLENGQLIVDVEDDQKVELVFNGVDIKCSYNAPIYILSAPKKVVIKLYDGSVNLVGDGDSYENLYDDNPSAAIYSKADLEFSGGGALYVYGNYNKGIYGKDDLVIDGGEIYVTSADDGIRGKDSVQISGGKTVINAGADGLRSSNTEDTDKGIISVSGGELYIESKNDGIQAENLVEISGGSIAVISGGGAPESSGTTQGGGMWGGSPWGGGNTQSSSDHGIKAVRQITIRSGSISLDCSGDALHCDDEINIEGTSLFIKAGDDGIHANETLNVNDGYIEISRSYEGYEAKKINVNGANTIIHSSDDGMNAAGGSSGGGGMWGGMGANTGDYLLSINGGVSYVYADGDGIDSNGNIVMTGGTMVVFGPTSSGNGAIDYGDGSCSMTISGGLLLAVGSQGMADCATGDNRQVIFASTGNISANTTVAIADEKNNIILAFSTPKTIQTIVFSAPELEKDGKYSVYSGGSSTGELVNNVYVGGNYSGGTLVTTVVASEAPVTPGPGMNHGGGPGDRPGGGRPR